MTYNRKAKLINLGTDVLADALLEVAQFSAEADELIDRLIASPEENQDRFKTKLASLKRSRRFIRWGESAAFARSLLNLLGDVQHSVDDPQHGAELVAAFYEADQGILGHCDDSSGHVGDVFRYDAKELFLFYARRCADKDWLTRLVLKLSKKDDYGIRDTLIDCASEYLPEPQLRTMVDHFQKTADKFSDIYAKRHWLHLVESLARQLKDALLFEKTRIASWGDLSTGAYIDISRVYLESGDAQTALSWVEKISTGEVFMAAERDALLLDIYTEQGDVQEQLVIALRKFRRSRCKSAFAALLEVVGQDKRESALAQEVAVIHEQEGLSLNDAAFLVEMDLLAEANLYLLKRAEQFDGDRYEWLPPLAEAMESSGNTLTASLLYRALIDSIMRRAQTKTYSHGVRYLKKLDRLATTISDWQNHLSHSDYYQQLRQNNGRKSSFWGKYGK